MKSIPSEGERLKWEPLDKAKGAKLTPELTAGKRLSSSNWRKEAGIASPLLPLKFEYPGYYLKFIQKNLALI